MILPFTEYLSNKDLYTFLLRISTSIFLKLKLSFVMKSNSDKSHLLNIGNINFLVGSKYKVIISDSCDIYVEYIFFNVFSFLFVESSSSSSESFINNFDSWSKFGNNFRRPPNANSILFFSKNISDEYKLKLSFGFINIFTIFFKTVIFFVTKSFTFLFFEFAIRHFIIEIYSINNFGLNLFSVIIIFSK